MENGSSDITSSSDAGRVMTTCGGTEVAQSAGADHAPQSSCAPLVRTRTDHECGVPSSGMTADAAAPSTPSTASVPPSTV